MIAVPMAHDVRLRREGLDGHDTSCLIICGTASAPCSPQLARGIEERFGCAVYTGFGATELGGGIAVSSLSDSLERRRESVVRPLLGTKVKIVDEAGRQVPPGQVGELVCCS